jgi:hypothetical protein
MSYEVIASATMTIGIRCECCGHAYSYETAEVAKRSSISWNDGLEQECVTTLQSQLEDRLARRDFGFAKCTHCRRHQSWMIEAYRATLLDRALVIAVALACMTCVFVLKETDSRAISLGGWWVGVFILAAATWYLLTRTIMLAFTPKQPDCTAAERHCVD